MTLEAEVQTLRQVPMFKDIDPARLKLLAFTSERVQFADRQRFFSQGDASDSAYVILEGRADVLLTTPTGEIKVAELREQCAGRRDGHFVRHAPIGHHHGVPADDRASDRPASLSGAAGAVPADVAGRDARAGEASGADKCQVGGKIGRLIFR